MNMSKTTPKSALARYRQLAPSASVRVSPLCLGAMNFGEAHKERYGECTKETAFAILDHFHGEGGNFIDTANAYQAGESETWLGEWMASRNNRDQIVLATKFTTGYMGHHQDQIQANFTGNGNKSLRVSVEASLKKLQTTYIDLLYVHWWDYTVTIPELMHNLNDLCVTGKVLYLGISDAPAWVVTKANQYARDHGLRQFVVYQGFWNAGLRDFERDIIPMCRDEGMGLCPYGTIGQGRFQTEEAFKEREKTKEGRNFMKLTDHDRRVSKALEDVASRKNTTIHSVALSYVMHKAPYVFPIVGGRKVDHLKGNIAAVEVELTSEDIDEIEQAYEFNHGFPHTFLSGTLFDGSRPRGSYGPGDVWLTNLVATYDWMDAPDPITPARVKAKSGGK